MYKKHSLILLPTDKANNALYKNKNGRQLNYHPGYLTQDYLKNSLNAESFHLYIVNDDKIKESNWYIADNKLYRAISNHMPELYQHSYKKIIATTDTSLFQTTQYEIEGNQKIQLPQIHKSFIQHYIEQYNLSNVITEVEVEYVIWRVFSGDHNNTPTETTLIINSPDNTINIKPLKDSWTREEVIAYGKLAFEVGRNFQLTGENNIKEIENNL